MTAGTATQYRTELDGLRAIAVLAVVVYHANPHWLPNGYLGVDVFFVISGYVITRSLLNRRARDGGHGRLGEALVSFYTRRVKRLMPAVMLCALGSAVAATLFVPPQLNLLTISLRTGVASLFGLSNLYLYRQATDYFGVDAELNFFTQTWSLGVEEQFYFLFPLLLWFLGITRKTGDALPPRRLRWLGVAVASLSAASLAAFALLYPRDPASAYFLVFARFWEIGLGVLVCLGEHQRGLPSAGPWLGWLSVLAVAATLAAPTQAPVLLTVAATLATALALLATAGPSGARALLRLRPMVHVGLLSYSLYLWHWPVLVVGRWTLGVDLATLPLWLALMFTFAELSYRKVERPLRRARWAATGGRTISMGLGASAVIGAGLLVLAGPLRGALHVGDDSWGQMTAVDPPNAPAHLTRACHAAATAGPALPVPKCQVEAGPRRLFFVGNSHSNHLRTAQFEVARRLGYSAESVSQSGCIFNATDTPDPKCSDLQVRVRDHILSRAKAGDVVVISNRYVIDWADGTPSWLERPGVVAALNTFAQTLRARGVAVGLLAPTPEFRVDVHACQAQWFRPTPSEHCAVSTDALQRRRAGALTLLRDALAPAVTVFDPLPTLCADGRCPMVDTDGLPLYRDNNHLSRHANTKLTARLEAWIRGMATPRP